MRSPPGPSGAATKVVGLGTRQGMIPSLALSKVRGCHCLQKWLKPKKTARAGFYPAFGVVRERREHDQPLATTAGCPWAEPVGDPGLCGRAGAVPVGLGAVL